ncbi:hypothetical protein KAI87_10710 [Myxococcota bacterium]|nr:hypothetical protein [Myxococcota bacterium]
MRIFYILLVSVFGGIFVSCSVDPISNDGRPCGDDPCLTGYACHPQTDICVPEINVSCTDADGICPSTVNTGDACTSSQSFIPCVDTVSDCSEGCRTCEENLTWSECTAEEIPSCDPCTDYYADKDNDTFGDAADSQCLCAAEGDYKVTDNTDCDDSNANCTTDCTDADSDDYCLGFDCDDGEAACSTDCTACTPSCDVCTDYYADRDNDDFGDGSDSQCLCDPAAPYDVTNSNDCDDTNASCGTDCTDTDGDDYCVDFDCDDNNDVCTTDCTACIVVDITELNLTVISTGITSSSTIELQIDTGSATADISASIVCTATRTDIWGPVDFTGAADLAAVSLASSKGGVGAANTDPFDHADCSTQGEFALLEQGPPNEILAFATAQDFTGFASLEVDFKAAVSTVATVDDILTLTPICTGVDFTGKESLLTATDMATACASHNIQIDALADECVDFDMTWFWGAATTNGQDLGIDDISFTALPLISTINVAAPGVYSATVKTGLRGAFDVTCTYSDLDATQTITIQ